MVKWKDLMIILNYTEFDSIIIILIYNNIMLNNSCLRWSNLNYSDPDQVVADLVLRNGGYRNKHST